MMKVDYTKHMPWIISYRGHGIVEKSRAETSIGHVMLHELRHLNQYRAKALWENRDIIEAHINIHIEIIDGVPVAVAGETVATFGPEKGYEKPELLVSSSEIENDEESRAEYKENGDVQTENRYEKEKIEDLRVEIFRKQQELKKIEDEIEELKRREKNGENVDSKIINLKMKKEEIKEELKKMKDAEIKKVLLKNSNSKTFDIAKKRFINGVYSDKLTQFENQKSVSLRV